MTRSASEDVFFKWQNKLATFVRKKLGVETGTITGAHARPDKFQAFLEKIEDRRKLIELYKRFHSKSVTEEGSWEIKLAT